MKRVEVTEAGGIKDHPYYPAEGDIITVPEVYADRWIACGWAKDAVTGEQGERIPGARKINPDGSVGEAVKVIQPDNVVGEAKG